MLVPWRRFQGIAVVAILILVMVGGFLPDPFVRHTSASQPAPAKEGTIGKIIQLFDHGRSYFENNMNYAASAPLLRSLVKYKLGASSSPQVYIGRNHHLFYSGDSAAAQSTGAVYRRPETLRFVEMCAILRRELARRGAKMIAAIPPNAQSVAIDDLPSWSRYKVRPPLEYDLAMQELGRNGIETVDLKAIFLESADGIPLYRLTDTHWNNRAAVLAFNLIVSASGHPKWDVDPTTALGPLGQTTGGDLAYFLGIARFLTDSDRQMLPGPTQAWEKLDILRSPPFIGLFDTYAYERKGASSGERVFVLGDSFTQNFWLPLLQRSDAERIGWMHLSGCGFDFADLERFEPTIVIMAPAERAMPCLRDAWPVGLPRS
jgi:alginate O-acetyltransferase complex protein AlgJ